MIATEDFKSQDNITFHICAGVGSVCIWDIHAWCIHMSRAAQEMETGFLTEL